MKRVNSSHLSPPGANPTWRIAIIHSSYYKEETGGLIAGAKETLLQAGIPEENITFHAAPGSFEVPLIGAAIAEAKKADALIGLGIIVEGETEHARLLAENAARGIMDVQVRYRIPFAFAVLYVHDLAVAAERARGEHNRGAEAARAVLLSLAELGRIHS